ncbi:MAG: hypothetical protein WAN43_01605 [Rhodomicrobium sp.]|jgi:hypothetical protein
MSEKPLADGRGEPVKDPVDQFMRQLSSSAAKHRRAVTGAPPVVVENKKKVARPKNWKAEEPLPPVIESVSVAEAEEVAGCWVVDALDSDNALLRAVFDGPDAEERAREYARWKYGADC